MPPQGRLEGFLGISGVRGATSVNDFSFAAKIGVGWVRAGISWAEINPAKGVYDWASTDQLLGNARAVGLKTVLMVRNTPAWAATTQPYSFVTTGRAAAKGGTNFPTPQRWTVTPSLDAAGLPSGYTTRRETLDGTLIDEVRSSFPNLRMANPDASWRVFIRELVGRYSQAPFDVKFFEIANEHRPESGQYPEDSVESVAERWFVPAAQEAHKFPGVRVLNSWGTDTASEQIDAFDAVPGVLENLDIFGQHYGDFDRWRRIFERYQLKGKPNIAFWATEYGDKPVDAFTWKVSHSYPAILGQVLARDWSDEDKFKVFWYPSKSKTKPYQSLADENGELTAHGRQVQVLYSLLYGKTLELYSDFVTAAKRECDGLRLRLSHRSRRGARHWAAERGRCSEPPDHHRDFAKIGPERHQARSQRGRLRCDHRNPQSSSEWCGFRADHEYGQTLRCGDANDVSRGADGCSVMR